MDGVEGWPHVRVRPAQGREVPQRRPRDGGGRQVLLRPVPGRRRQAPQGPGARGPDRRSRPGALPVERAVAGLHDLLRHVGHRGGVDRAEEVRGEGGRRRLLESARGRRALPRGELLAGRGARDGGVRRLLAQGPRRQAAGLPEHGRRDDARRRPQGGRRGHRVSAERADRRRGQADAGVQAGRGDAARRRLPRSARAVGSEIAVARPARAAGRQPCPRPQRPQSGRDPRALAPDWGSHSTGPGLLTGLRAAGLRSRSGQEAPGRGRLSQRLRRRGPDPVSSVLLAGRGHRQLSPDGRHPDASAHDGARRLPHRVARRRSRA